jgi:TPP-dependent indolepyruvate ferredoxin oxidoreductase alpha subunit
MKRAILSGNEAIARGAFEAGVRVASAYPGTPSTEILENIVNYPGIDASWSPNEKVALEVGIGACFGGARALVAMKHVGVNVAADPLFTLSYTGVRGGLVLVTADDPELHSSQNEQDNRNYAKFAKIPMFEAADSQEALIFTRLAFEVSETFDTPVFLRTTTRISHSKSIATLGEPVKDLPEPSVERNPPKFVMLPGNARQRHLVVEERLRRMEEWACEQPFNTIEVGKGDTGIITSGVSYQYAKETLPTAHILKLGMVYPLPKRLIREFAARFKTLYVIEELDPFIEEQVRAMPPLSSMDTCVCMGASIGNATGLSKVLSLKDRQQVVAVIGDSTFLHSGISGLMDMVYNKSTSTVIILDNRITAMTGRQENPSSGFTLAGEETYEVDLEAVCRAVGVKHVQVVDPYELEITQQAIQKEMERPEASVIIARRPCMLIKRDVVERKPPLFVDPEKCTSCKACLKLGCPAIEWQSNGEGKGVARVNRLLCVGCGICQQVCKFDAFGVCHDE